jgi:uncharacterized membrane protein YcaP (DUF421 family)
MQSTCNIKMVPGFVHTVLLAGHFVEKHMRHCQLTEEKVKSELRQKGYINMNELFAIILEPPGKFAIVTKSEWWPAWTLEVLEGVEAWLSNLSQALCAPP